MESSNNSSTAKSGFKAEEHFRMNPIIRNHLEQYFMASIDRIEAAPPRMKCDNIIFFTDGSRVRIQNKKFERFGGRGDSFDRRPVSGTFDNPFLRKYLTALTLFKGKGQSTGLGPEQKRQFEVLCRESGEDCRQLLRKTLVGQGEYRNDYWVFMKSGREFDCAKTDLWITPSLCLLSLLESRIEIKAARTCLHLSDLVYIQRKGGSKGENAPNDVQMKLKIDRTIVDSCKHILKASDP